MELTQRGAVELVVNGIRACPDSYQVLVSATKALTNLTATVHATPPAETLAPTVPVGTGGVPDVVAGAATTTGARTRHSASSLGGDSAADGDVTIAPPGGEGDGGGAATSQSSTREGSDVQSAASRAVAAGAIPLLTAALQRNKEDGQLQYRANQLLVRLGS